MSERSDRFRDEMKAEILAGIRENQKVPEMYDNLRYCGDCPGGPLLYGDGTCPSCKKSNAVKFEETKPREPE